MNRRSILLIGGTGTISASIMKLLSSSGDWDVTVLNRGHREFAPGIGQIICDVKEPGALEKAVADRRFDAVVDFLVFDAESAAERVRIFRQRAGQYFFISTVVTFEHEHTVWLDENSKQENQYSSYGQKKKAAEDVFRAAAAEGFPAVIVRPSQTYAGDRIPLSVKGKSCWSVISRILAEKPVIIHGDGKSIWHMMHADDFAYNFVQMIGNQAANGQSVNLVHPEVVTWDMIYEEIASQLNRKLIVRHIASDALAHAGRYDIAATILGDKQYSSMYRAEQRERMIPDFRCRIDLKQGVRKYLAYMEEHPESRMEDPEFDEWCDALIRDYDSFMELVAQKY